MKDSMMKRLQRVGQKAAQVMSIVGKGMALAHSFLQTAYLQQPIRYTLGTISKAAQKVLFSRSY